MDGELRGKARAARASFVTWVGLGVNVALTAFKYAAGFLGHSGAMIADATHSLSDLITDIVVILGFRIVSKPADHGHDYGHGKVETLLAAICGFFLLAAGAGIFWSGSCSIWNVLRGHPIVRPGVIAFIAAVLSVVLKEALYWYTLRAGRTLNSSAIVAKAWDHRSDAFSSIGTSVGIGGAMLLGERWRILDPLAAVIVSVFIVKVAIPIIRESLDELLEASLDHDCERRIREIIERSAEVSGSHKLRTRKIGTNMAVDVHVVVRRDLSLVDAHSIADRIEDDLRTEFGREMFVTLHVEPDAPSGSSAGSSGDGSASGTFGAFCVSVLPRS
jgi:cation diffusion facilitator family transporter